MLCRLADWQELRHVSAQVVRVVKGPTTCDSCCQMPSMHSTKVVRTACSDCTVLTVPLHSCCQHARSRSAALTQSSEKERGGFIRSDKTSDSLRAGRSPRLSAYVSRSRCGRLRQCFLVQMPLRDTGRCPARTSCTCWNYERMYNHDG